jgi:ATP-binding cassette subfamily B protein
VDLADLDVSALRARIATVFQDFVCYELTARDNIALGALAAEPAAVPAAAARAGVHDTLAGLPHGYDTMLSRSFAEPAGQHSGVLLSGGQWQRVAVARALLRSKADLLILDEPSSGLDAQAEAELHQALRAHRHGRTTLLISHRLGSLSDADNIVVLDQGRIVEQGDHERLMLLDGVYARLFRLQAAGYTDAGAGAPA